MSVEETESVFVCDDDNDYEQDKNQNRLLSI